MRNVKPNIGKRFSKEWKRNISESLIGNKYTLGHKCSESHKERISKSLRGNKCYLYGKCRTEDVKRKIRIGVLKRLEKNGIPCCIDKGAVEWFDKYNKETNSKYKPKRFFDIGYDADGYDSDKHIWIEYDTDYHKCFGQSKRDKIRQRNIIQHFEEIGEPLVEFKRVLAYNNNKMITKYRGYCI